MEQAPAEQDRPVTWRDMPGGRKVRWDAELAARWQASGEWLGTTLGALAHDLARAEPDRVLLVEQEREFTAAALYREARRLAGALIRRGLKPGDVVSYQIPNWYEGSVINTAAALAGLIVNPLVPIYREREVRFMLEDVGTRLVFVPERFRGFDYAAMYAALNQTLAEPVQIVVLRGSHPGALSYADLLDDEPGGSSDAVPLPAVDPDSIYVLMHTSGTTGRPKCVVHSHNTFLAQGKVHSLGLRGPVPDVQIVATPISHIAGIILANLNPVIGGARVVLMDTWNPEEAVRLVERHQASACNGATPFLKGLLDAAQAAGKHLPSLTNGGYGGAAVPPELLYQACAWFPNLVTFRIYGCTECPTATGRIATRAELDHGCRTDGLIRHTEIRLADPVTGAPAAPGAEGEILLRGATMMLGYLRAEDNAGAFDAEGFFRSGDLGRIVDGHYLVVTGRKKDLIIRNGENLSPQEIEDALFAHPGIDAVAVVGMPSAKTGEAVCAFVVPKPGRTIDLPDIARHLVAQGLARQKIPEHLELVERLPTSPQGKVLKTELRETARRLAASPAGGEGTSALLNLN